MQFCGECGRPLQPRCPQCGFENPPAFKFCGLCGTTLTRPAALATPTEPGALRDVLQDQRPLIVQPSAARGVAAAERRQLTVLFCDVVESTRLAGQLDLEELRQVVQGYQAACAAVIERLDGYIAQYLGDGLLVYFGYPRAHEDDAQRAVRAGLGMVEVIAQFNTRLQEDIRASLAVRVGIHTGLVVVGTMGGGGRQEQLALGETPNLAARLQGLAEPHAVVISGATYRMVRGSSPAGSLARRR